MSDRIALTGIRSFGRHGVLDAERRDGQQFVVDAELDVDLRPSAASDDLADTVDYGALARRIHSTVAGEPVRLIETLADAIATACLEDARVRAARVTVHKPDAPIDVPFADVSVTVARP